MLRTFLFQNFKRAFTTFPKGIRDNQTIQKLANSQNLQPQELFDRFVSQFPNNVKSYSRTDNIIEEIGDYAKVSYDLYYMSDERKVEKEELQNKKDNLRMKYDEIIHLCEESIKQRPCFLPAYYIKATLLQNKAPSFEALIAWDQILKLDHDSVEAYRNKGRIYAKEGKTMKAIMSFEKASSIDPTFLKPFFEKAQIWESIERWDQAIDCYDKIIASSPNETKAYFLKGEAFRRLNQYSQAIECFGKVVQLEPDNFEAYFLKGVMLYELDRSEEALKDFNRVSELRPKLRGVFVHKAKALRDLGRFEEELKCYDVIIEWNSSELVKIMKATCLMNLGKAQEAVECFSAIIADNLTINYFDHLNPTYIFKSWTQAIQICDEILASQPDLLSAQKIKKFSEKKIEEALEKIQNSNERLAKEPKNIYIFFNKVQAFGEIGQYEEALECVDKALEINPQSTSFIWLQDRYAKAAGRYDEAIQNYERFIPLHTQVEKVPIRNHSGYSFCPETIEHYEKKITLNPNNAEAYRQKAVVLYQFGKFDKAIQTCEKAIELNPGSSDAYQTKAVALFEQQNFSEALVYCDKVLSLKGDVASIYNLKATCLGMLGRNKEALECFNTAKKLNPIFDGGYKQLKRQVLFRCKKWKEVIEYCDRFFSEKSTSKYCANDDYYFYKGRSFEMLGDYFKGLEYYNKVFFEDYQFGRSFRSIYEVEEKGIPNNLNACFSKGRILHALGHYEIACECFDPVINLCPDFAGAYRMRGLCLEKLGKPGAEDDLEIARFLDPEIDKKDNSLKIDLDHLPHDLVTIKNMSKEELRDHFYALMQGVGKV